MLDGSPPALVLRSTIASPPSTRTLTWRGARHEESNEQEETMYTLFRAILIVNALLAALSGWVRARSAFTRLRGYSNVRAMTRTTSRALLALVFASGCAGFGNVVLTDAGAKVMVSANA